eukprot:gnl/Hemi2/601_TR213_c0_g1_i1.p1 gnl/Hemi2/601_TR213_c0_g1~~gnl/Hemi2/601_TR213_c0_g1_i1.p1  ORF type:complete len:309 (-),score=28.86 gnl/Hemi2/601_TR213_c0_g1_i1:133-1059(-)
MIKARANIKRRSSSALGKSTRASSVGPGTKKIACCSPDTKSRRRASLVASPLRSRRTPCIDPPSPPRTKLGYIPTPCDMVYFAPRGTKGQQATAQPPLLSSVKATNSKNAWANTGSLITTSLRSSRGRRHARNKQSAARRSHSLGRILSRIEGLLEREDAWNGPNPEQIYQPSWWEDESDWVRELKTAPRGYQAARVHMTNHFQSPPHLRKPGVSEQVCDEFLNRSRQTTSHGMPRVYNMPPLSYSKSPYAFLEGGDEAALAEDVLRTFKAPAISRYTDSCVYDECPAPIYNHLPSFDWMPSSRRIIF